MLIWVLSKQPVEAFSQLSSGHQHPPCVEEVRINLNRVEKDLKLFCRDLVGGCDCNVQCVMTLTPKIGGRLKVLAPSCSSHRWRPMQGPAWRHQPPPSSASPTLLVCSKTASYALFLPLHFRHTEVFSLKGRRQH